MNFSGPETTAISTKNLTAKARTLGAFSAALLFSVLLVPSASHATHTSASEGLSTITTSGNGDGGFTLVLNDSGEIYGSGANDYGQLGNGTETNSQVPIAVDATGVLLGKTIISVSSGESFALALDDQGKVYAWGDNSSGQLGDGTTDSSSVPVAVDVTGALAGKKIVSIAAGPGHALALDEDGLVYGWGNNSYGQLGDNTYDDKMSPIAIAGGALNGLRLKAISAGGIYSDYSDQGSFSLAISTDGRVYSWGDNQYGQLGIDSYNESLVPVAVNTSGVLEAKTIVEIATGPNFAFALDSQGSVYGWGKNEEGQLGDGSTTNRLIAVAVDSTGVLAGKVIKQIAAGYTVGIAVDAAGLAYSWGENSYGELGDGSTSQRTSPVAVTATGALAGQKILEIDAGYYSAVALTESGKVIGWGDDTDSRTGLGLGPTISKPKVLGFTGSLANSSVSAIAFGNQHTLFLDANGAVHASGANYSGQIGDGLTVAALDPKVAGTASDNVLFGKTIVQVSAGVNHSLALDSTGKVYAWGANSDGQLGIGTTTNSAPTLVEGALAGKRIVQIVAGGYHSLALDTDGIVYAWGDNAFGQLGIDSTIDSTTPVAINALGPMNNEVIDLIVAGDAHSAAMTAGGKVFAWGRNTSGQVGIGTTANVDLPIDISNAGALSGKVITSIASGGYHLLALDNSGNVYAWGSNYAGQVGDGTTVNKLTPQAITGGALAGKVITSIDSGQVHSLALDNNGNGYAWGANDYGQLGNASYVRALAPIALGVNTALAGKRLTTLAGEMGQSTYAIDSDNEIYSWGNNYTEQLGFGATESYRSPVLTGFTGHASVVEQEGEQGGDSGSGSSETPVATAYQGPMATSFSTTTLFPGEITTIFGQRLNLVVSITIDGLAVKILSQTKGSLTLELPQGLSAGTKNLVMQSTMGQLTLQDAVTVRDARAASEQLSTKIKAGSFNGLVAIYAKGHQGKRFSAKVGKDWIVIPSLKTDFVRVLEKTVSGKKLNIRIYIDRKLIETMELTTR